MLSPTLDFANGSVPSYGGTLLYFMGFLISLNQIPPWWIWYSYIDFLRHAYVGMMVNEFWVSDVAFLLNFPSSCGSEMHRPARTPR